MPEFIAGGPANPENTTLPGALTPGQDLIVPLELRADDPRDEPLENIEFPMPAGVVLEPKGHVMLSVKLEGAAETFTDSDYNVRVGDIPAILENSTPVEVHDRRDLAILGDDEIINYQVIPGRQIKEVLGEMEAKYMPAVIAGTKDKVGAATVKMYKIHTKEVISAVKARRVENKAGILEWGRKVDAAAVEILRPLEAIKDHLEKEERRIAVEKEAEAEAKRVAAQAVLQARIDKITAVGGVSNVALLTSLTEKAFQAYLKEATEAHIAAQHAKDQAEAAARDQAAKTAQEAKAKEEADRLEKKAKDEEAAKAIADEQARQEVAAREQKARQVELDRQAAELKDRQAKLDADKAETERLAREEKIRVDAAEQARKDAEAKAEREKLAREAADKAAAEAKAAQEKRAAEIAAAAPDADKLALVAAAVLAIQVPEMATAAGKLARLEIIDARNRFEKFIHAKAAGLTEYNVPAV